MLKTQVGRFKIIALAEGISFLLILFITMPLKYYLEIAGPNKVIGMIHGLLFIWYVFAVIQLRIEKGWNSRVTFLALLASILPFGTFYFTAKVLPETES